MTVSVLCTNPEHPVWPSLRRWRSDQEARGHTVLLCADQTDLTSGDVLFLVSCGQIIREAERKAFGAVLVLHASDLPRGRGWSPHIWQIIDGAGRITVSLLEARDPLDTGDIWLKTRFDLAGHELLPEINKRLFAAELALMTRAVNEFDTITPRPQAASPAPSCGSALPTIANSIRTRPSRSSSTSCVSSTTSVIRRPCLSWRPLHHPHRQT